MSSGPALNPGEVTRQLLLLAEAVTERPDEAQRWLAESAVDCPERAAAFAACLRRIDESLGAMGATTR